MKTLLLLLCCVLFYVGSDAQQYCTRTFNQYSSADIYNVIFNTIKNLESDNPDSGYTFYPDSVFTTYVTIGYTYPLTVTGSSMAGVRYSCAAWIDYNHNFVFDSTEQVLIAPLERSGVAYVTIPNDTAILGATRLRVIRGNHPQPCGQFSNDQGEIEDYVIHITDSVVQPDYCIPVSLYATAEIDDFKLNDLFNCNTRSDTGSYSVYSDSAFTTLLEINTAYDLYISNGVWAGITTSYAVWIDFNNDYIFSDTEKLYEDGPDIYATWGTVTIPNDTTLIGRHRMRVRAGIDDPCLMERHAEAEDYYVTIIPDTLPDVIVTPHPKRWEKKDELAGSHYGLAIKETYDKGFFIVTNATEGNIVVMKTDINGDTLWTKVIRDTSSTWYDTWNVVETDDGGLLIGGSTNDQARVQRSFVIKVDACGEEEWVKLLENEYDPSWIPGMRQLSDSNYAALSHFSGGPDEAHLYKLDRQGDTIWQRSYARYEYQQSVALLESPDGGFLITGSAYTPDPGDSSGTLYLRSTLIKTDSLGNMQWTHALGEADRVYSAPSASRNAGGYFLTVVAYYDSSEQKYVPGLFKTDAQGQEVWMRRLPLNPTFNYGRMQLVAIDDNYSVVATLKTDDCAEYDYLISVSIIDSAAHVLHSKILGERGTVIAGIDVTSNQKIAVCGNIYEQNEYTLYTAKLDLALEFDTFYNVSLNYDSLCGVTPAVGALPAAHPYSISVVPNPFDQLTNVTIHNFDNSEYDVALFDIQGKQLKSYPQNRTRQFTIDRQTLAGGIYFLEIKFRNGDRYSVKVMVN